MSPLKDKFKALHVIIRPLDAFINCFVVMFIIFFIGTDQDIKTAVLGGITWLFISFANAIIKEYYETVHLKLIFPGNILVKEIISPAESMAYYTYFTLSAIFLSTYIGVFPLVLTVFVTLFNKYSSKKCRKNPYRFPFSRGITTGIMILYSALEYSNANLLLIPAALFAFLTYIINFIDYSRYYEKITDKKAKLFLSVLIPAFIFFSTLPFSQKLYNLYYLIIITFTANLTLLFVLLKIFKGYRKSGINNLVLVLKLNLIAISIAVYTGL